MSAGRKPPLPYKQATQKRRERQRMEAAMKPIAAIGGAPAPPKRVDVRAARTAANPAQERAVRRAERLARKAQQRAAREAAAKEAADREAAKGKPPLPGNEAQPEPQPRSARPQTPEPRRYEALKGG